MPSESIKDIDPSSDKKFPSLMTKIPDEKVPNVFSLESSDDRLSGFTSESSAHEINNKVVKIKMKDVIVLNIYLD